MGRKQNVKLAEVFGIRIGVEWSWFLVLFIVIFILRSYFASILPSSSEAFLVAVLCALLFFTSLVLHELGHALVARRLGLQIDGIDLWMLGGFTRTRGDVKTPGGEFSLAAAGPAVTGLLALVCVGAGLLFGSFHTLLDVALLKSAPRHVNAALAMFGWLAFINCLLLLFNLVPAYPLDGGRIAQAVIWQLTGDRDRATRRCAQLGQVFGWIVMAGGLALIFENQFAFGLWSVLIGVFLEQASRRAVVQSAIGARIRDFTVADIMDTDPLTIPADTSMLSADSEYFQRHQWPWFAVVDASGHYLGLLRRDRVQHELADGRPALTAAEVSDDAAPWRIDASANLEALLGSEGLRVLGAVIAVDSEGMLRGVVTLQAIRRALGAPVGV